jgi:hypothetical protein
MIYKLQAQSGSCRHSMWCGAAEQTGMPSPSEQDDWGACTFFGGACCTLRHLAAVIEGSLGILGDSDLSRSFTLSGQRSNTDECHIGRQRSGLSRRTVGATSWSGEGYGLLVVSAPDNTAPHCPRHHGNPCAEKVRPHRPRQSFGSGGRTFAPLESAGLLNRGRSQDQRKALLPKTMASEPDACAGVGSPRQGTLTITGSNVRLGTEMPVALSLFP